MAYARFSNDSKWYIFWSDTAAVTAENECVELVHVSAPAPIALSFSAAKGIVATGELPSNIENLARDDAQVVLAALRDFVDDVSAHYRVPSSTQLVSDDAVHLMAEAQKLSELLRGQIVVVVRRPHLRQLVLEFGDGTRVLINAKSSDIEISVE